MGLLLPPGRDKFYGKDCVKILITKKYMALTDWLSHHYIEIFGAVTGIIYVFLEIRQNIWLWPVGILTSAVYIWVFFTSKFYADMSLQGYYLVISIIGWYWWREGRGQGAGSKERRRVTMEQRTVGNNSSLEGGQGDVTSTIQEKNQLSVTRITRKTAIILSIVFVFLYAFLWLILDRFTDSPVQEWDSFITSLSIIATWMLARKIYEHWYLWIVVNLVSVIVFLIKGLHPTVILYAVYCGMSFAGLREWKKTIK
jgi:nicotinamide mononucleotide transporter